MFPVSYAIAIKAVLFDGMRHFIFVLPSIAVAAALIADRALTRLSDLPYRAPIYAALALYGAAHVGTMVMLHPDQYVYYNAFVGGVDGAQRKFKLDYWAYSYAEAVHGLGVICATNTAPISKSANSRWQCAGRQYRPITIFRRTFGSFASAPEQISLSRLPRTIATIRCRASPYTK